MNVNKALKKTYETQPLKDIANAPVEALEGISDAGAENLKKTLGVRTVRDLATNKFVLRAQGLLHLADCEE